MRLNLDGPFSAGSRSVSSFFADRTAMAPSNLVISIELNKNLHGWFDPDAGKQPDHRTGLAHYHGDF